MTSAWLLPEHVADVLPAQARRVEELRRTLLDAARGYGFELVIPPVLEHLESLLSGAGHELDLQTFKLVDQLSGRMLGVRADTTPQVARIDAHLLNRVGVTRLCYCGPVLHTRPAGPHGSREPLQFGAEIYGHAGLEADLEVQDLALFGLQRAGLGAAVLDLSDARLLAGALQGVALTGPVASSVVTALASKDSAALDALADKLPAGSLEYLKHLTELYGGREVLDAARARLPQHPLVDAALRDLAWLADRVSAAYPAVQVGFDLADLNGHGYYTGPRFAIYAPLHGDALVRGGRYDEVGAIFGRRRPAVGFSLDLKALVERLSVQPPQAAIRAPWGEEWELREAIRRLRTAGEAVVCVLPGHEHEVQEFSCDRELVRRGESWVVQPI